MNIAEIESSFKELVETPFDADTFIFRFLEIYDAPKATVTKLRQGTTNHAKEPGELLWKNKLFFRIAEKGRAAATVDAMAGDPLAKKHAPRFLLATDGEEVYCRDIKADQTRDSSFDKLNDIFDFFLPLAGIERYEGVAENPADIKATARLAKLYDAILEANPEWVGNDHTHELNLFMTRMLFCFFAEDTSIFEKDLFTSTLMDLTREDGTDTSSVLEIIFAVMNTHDKEREGLPEFARRFPFVNGGLFHDKTPIPKFSKRARRLLKECGELQWKDINPDIFGSMIQAVVEPGLRGDMGMHYRGSLTEVIQIIGRSTRDAPGKSHAQFTNLIAEPDASAERVTDAVNNMLKAIACSLLMEQVLAPNFKFKTRADADALDGSRRESDIVYTGDDNIIAIRGFAEPSSARTRQILESDLNDLSAAIFQDEAVLRAAMNPDEYAPEVVNQVFIPKVIARQYPDLTAEEIEEVRQAVVANGVFKSPSVSIEQQADTKFVRMAEKLINIDEISIDLIDSINPFQRAYEILSKSVTADVLKTIHGAITSTKVAMSEEEAVSLYPRIKAFVAEKKVEPSLVSPNPLERRMAEALAWIREAKRRRMAAAQRDA